VALAVCLTWLLGGASRPSRPLDPRPHAGGVLGSQGCVCVGVNGLEGVNALAVGGGANRLESDVSAKQIVASTRPHTPSQHHHGLDKECGFV